MDELKSISEVNLSGKKVLLRVDYNVPLKEGRVADDSRIKATLPTLKYLINKGASVVILSHLGRPEGKRSSKFSLKPAAEELGRILGKKIGFSEYTIGPMVKDRIDKLGSGEVLVLENLRFSSFEELNDEEFAKKLADLGDIFVQDAFANAHRRHASMDKITKHIPSYAGLLFEKEYNAFKKLLEKPKKPFVVVLGGKKVETKIDLLDSIIAEADIILIGGGMANTFLVAEGYEVGKSFYEEDYVTDAEDIIRKAEDEGTELIIPDDVLVAASVKENIKPKVKLVEQIDDKDVIVDVGPETLSKYKEPINFAGSIFWNGPLGIAEFENFSEGTKKIAEMISESDSVSIIGGGDTLAAIDNDKNFDYVSTAGGAALEFVSRGTLPAVEGLIKEDKK